MPHRLLELMELPGQVIGAIAVITGSIVTGAVTLLAQLPPAAAGVVSEAPTWFLGFVAAVVLSLGWACLTLARYVAVTQTGSNEAVRKSMDKLTLVLNHVAQTIERQNRFWEQAGINIITRMTEDPPSGECSPLASSSRSKQS